MVRTRLDKLVLERGLASTREKAQALILAGQIHVNGQPATKAGTLVAADARVELVGEPVDLVTIDVAFISVEKILPAAIPCAKPAAVFLILVKPQFELSRREVGKGGIVRDAALQQKAVERIRRAAAALGLAEIDVRESCLPGAEGNREFFLRARLPA